MGNKPFGWCSKHCFTVSPRKYREKCKVAKHGQVCKSFSFSLPEWRRATTKSGKRYAQTRKRHAERMRRYNDSDES